MSHRRPHAFKILCPEPLASGVLGHRGSTKDRIQDECHCRLVMSNRDEFYPGTRLRLVVIQAEEQLSILKALDRVLDLLAECAETERQNPNGRTAVQGEPDFLGKEHGELVLRAAVPFRVGSAIIGPKGAHVQALKEEAGAKIIIDKEHQQGHQACRLAARPEGLRIVLSRISDYMAEDAAQRPSEFDSWASIRNFGQQEDGHGGYGQSHSRDGHGRDSYSRNGRESYGRESYGRESYGRDGHGREGYGREGYGREGYGRDGGRDGHNSYGGSPASHGGHAQSLRGPGATSWDQAGGARSRSPGRFAATRAHLPAAGPLEMLASALSGMQPGAVDYEYEVTCELPPQKVSAMIGPGGQIVRNVRQTTGTHIHFDEVPHGAREQTMRIKGPLLGVYRAHVMMMQRYHEHETELFEPKGKGAAPAKGGKSERRSGWDAKGRDGGKGREPMREPIRQPYREQPPPRDAGKGRTHGGPGRPERSGESREHLEDMLANLERQMAEETLVCKSTT
eukprot:s480_g3.t1